MKSAKIVLVALLAISLAGCLLSGKPKPAPTLPAVPQPVATPPPPPKLSIPQTELELPVWQPYDADALNAAPKEEAPAPTLTKPVTPPKTQRPAAAPPVASKPPETPPVETPPAEPPRPPMQEVLPADQLKQFQDSARNHRSETMRLLGQAHSRHRFTLDDSRVEVTIKQFLSSSEQAEKNGDMRSADEFASKAIALAEVLPGAK